MEIRPSQRSLIIGAGEIGSSLYEVLKRRSEVYIRDVEDNGIEDVDVLHIAFGYSDGFVDAVKAYIEQYDPNFTIVYSTVPIGTCERIGAHIIHSPVEGRHPHLEDSIMLMPRWLACADKVSLSAAMDFWKPHAKIIRTMRSSVFTEFLKLRSTSKYGINLVWADYEAKVAELIGMSYSAVKEFDEDYNKLYADLGLGDVISRYILDPPNGFIGGHCIVPNAELLDKQFPDPMLKAIKKMKRKGGSNANQSNPKETNS